ncbi:MAG: C4-dicarboxylate transporter permease [Deltaproteobacteria bacterium]|nr:C4-dicarboxylate transporter permease [Deltaproteobacteria bacterium]
MREIKTLRWIEKLSHAGGAAAGICILLMTALILIEIIIRAAAGASILIAEEYSAYLLASFGTLALAYTFKSGGHIRVDLVLSKLSGRGRGYVNLGCTVIAFFIFVFAAYETWGLFYGSWLSKETSMYYSKTRLWLPQFPIVLGTGLMALQLLASVVDQIQSLGTTGREAPRLDRG